MAASYSRRGVASCDRPGREPAVKLNIALGTVAVGIAFSACGGTADTSSGPSSDDASDEAPAQDFEEPDDANGPTVPRQFPQESYPGERMMLQVDVRLAGNGCWHADLEGANAMVVWPAGAELGNNGDQVVLATGEPVPDGATVKGAGAIVAAADLPGENGYWDHITGYCAAGDDRVVVFDDLVVVGPDQTG